MLAKITNWVFIAASLLLVLLWLSFTDRPILVMGFAAVCAGAILGSLASRAARYFLEPGPRRVSYKVKYEN
jgi:multisubunit Na+/H+ antiporter MnhE subunit